MPDDRPILFFDSGVGGLSVLAPCAALLPHAPLVYVADSAGFPYGTRSEGEIAARVPALLGRLAERYDPRLIVIACNTVSTIALQHVRAVVSCDDELHPYPPFQADRGTGKAPPRPAVCFQAALSALPFWVYCTSASVMALTLGVRPSSEVGIVSSPAASRFSTGWSSAFSTRQSASTFRPGMEPMNRGLMGRP